MNGRNIEVTIDGQGQRPRNRRRRHEQRMRVSPFLLECRPLLDAKAMLFVCDDKAEGSKFYIFLNECMRANDDMNRAIG